VLRRPVCSALTSLSNAAASPADSPAQVGHRQNTRSGCVPGVPLIGNDERQTSRTVIDPGVGRALSTEHIGIDMASKKCANGRWRSRYCRIAVTTNPESAPEWSPGGGRVCGLAARERATSGTTPHDFGGADRWQRLLTPWAKGSRSMPTRTFMLEVGRVMRVT
jgi:hypothetical protein